MREVQPIVKAVAITIKSQRPQFAAFKPFKRTAIKSRRLREMDEVELFELKYRKRKRGDFEMMWLLAPN